MAYFLDLPKYKDERGILTLIQDGRSFLPFEAKRIFCIDGTSHLSRGGHKHILNIEAVICVKGYSTITTYQDPNGIKISHALTNSDQCLVLPANEWRVLHSFSKDAYLLVFASEVYDSDDYIFLT